MPFQPFALNLAQQARALLQHLHITRQLDKSPFLFLPFSHLHVLQHVASTPNPTLTPQAFIDVLSDLLEIQPLAEKVAELFRPLLLVIMARWLERMRGGRDEWIRRISSGVLIADCVEEVWP